MRFDYRFFRMLSVQLLIGASISPLPAAVAQEEPSRIDPPGQRQEPSPPPNRIEASGLTDAERLLRIERVLELDREKLVEARDELARRQSFLDRLGEETRKLALELEETRSQRQEVGEAADPEEVQALEAEIAELETEVELYATQTDLALTAESTVRKQIEALEKKLEREQRAIDALRGVAAPGPVQPTRAPQGAAPEPSVPPGLVSGLPGVSTTAVEPEPKPAVSRVETTAQVEALREVERLEAEVARAELALVEFVKRKESLQQQVGFEEVLRDTARGSVENLARAREVRQKLLQDKTEAGAGEAELRSIRRSLASIEELIEEGQSEIERRGEYIESLQARLEQTRSEEELVVQQVEDKRREAKRARETLYWLESPIHPRNVWRWLRERGPRMLLVVVAAGILLLLLRLSVRRIARIAVRRRRGQRGASAKRADTLALSVRSAASVLILVGALLLVFQEAGVDIKTVLGGAAILGFAIAFGAQNLMRDYFTGFMILLEDQYELGDLVTIGSVTGTVERVNMRTTVLRDLEGRVHFIPNGDVKSVTNRTYVWGRAVIDVPVSYRENVDRVMEVIRELAEEFRSEPEFGSWVTEEPVVLGVDKFTEYGVLIKFMIKTRPDKMFQTRRELLRRVKNRFDQEGIEISVPHRTLLFPTEGDQPDLHSGGRRERLQLSGDERRTAGPDVASPGSGGPADGRHAEDP